MTGLLVAELVFGLSGCAVFTVLFRRRRRWRTNRESMQLAVMIAYLGGLIGLRLAALVVVMPVWVWAVAWAPLGPVMWRWVWLLRQPKAG